MSGIFSLFREVLLINHPEKARDYYLFWRCVFITFIISAVTLWVMERTKVLNLQSQLDKLTEPKFEIAISSTVTAEMDLSDGSKQCLVLASVAVFNHGAPSVLRGWKMKVTTMDGKEYYGKPWLMSGPNAPKYLSLGRSKFGPNEIAMDGSLFLKGTAAPILLGGSADGHMTFLFPAELAIEAKKPGTVVALELMDVLQHPSYGSHVITGSNNEDGILATPSMR